jgi:hypothetical protein
VKGRVGFSDVVLLASALFLVAAWLHFPYGGGRVYSDIVTVFQTRECNPVCSLPLTVPYLQSFNEYPVLTAAFMYVMGQAGWLFPASIVDAYYVATCIVLFGSTLLLIRELHTLALMRGFPDGRILWYFVVTPCFLILLLVNWYVIGTLFTFAGIRYWLQGRRTIAGTLFGLSAAANLVTAVPALGLVLADTKWRSSAKFALSGAVAWGAVNLPFVLSNPAQWFAFWSYHFNWYVEGSWLLLLVTNTSPLRHLVFPVTFAAFLAIAILIRWRVRPVDPLNLCFILTFGFMFSTYVFTPQMDVLLLPFFVVLPRRSRYLEVLAYGTLGAFVIVAFSGTLQLFGVNFSFQLFGPGSLIQLAAAARSLWTGKFALYDGVYGAWKGNQGGAAIQIRPPAS